MKKQLLKFSSLKIVFLASALSLFCACEEKVIYGWGDINESLGLIQKARNELKEEISNLEEEGYDTGELEEIDNRLRKAENILDKHFY